MTIGPLQKLYLEYNSKICFLNDKIQNLNKKKNDLNQTFNFYVKRNLSTNKTAIDICSDCVIKITRIDSDIDKLRASLNSTEVKIENMMPKLIELPSAFRDKIGDKGYTVIFAKNRSEFCVTPERKHVLSRNSRATGTLISSSIHSEGIKWDTPSREKTITQETVINNRDPMDVNLKHLTKEVYHRLASLRYRFERDEAICKSKKNIDTEEVFNHWQCSAIEIGKIHCEIAVLKKKGITKEELEKILSTIQSFEIEYHNFLKSTHNPLNQKQTDYLTLLPSIVKNREKNQLMLRG